MILIDNICFSQKYSVDTSEVKLEKSGDYKQSVDSYLRNAESLNYINPDKSIEYSNKAYDLAVKNKYLKGLVMAFYEKGTAYKNKASYDKALYYLNNSLEILESIDAPELADNYRAIGEVFYYKNEPSKALNYYFKSIEISEENNDYESSLKTYTDIGFFYTVYNKLEESYYYLNIALNVSKKTGNNNKNLNFLYYTIGYYYFNKNELDSALSYYKKSLELYSNEPNDALIHYPLLGIGHIYEIRKNNDDAIKYYLKALNISKKSNYKIGIGNSLERVSNFYLNTGDNKQAIEYGKIYFEYSKIYHEEDNASLILSKAYEKMGNTTESYKYLKLFVEKSNLLNETLFKDLNAQVFDEEQEIQKTQLAKKELEIKQQRTEKYAFIGGFVLVILLTMIILFSLLQKRRDNKIIAAEKAKSDTLLLNILPSETVEELKKYGHTHAQLYEKVTVLFTDFKEFTKIAETLSPEKLVEELDYCFQAFDRIVSKYNIEKIKTIGDSYMCAGGIPLINTTNPSDVIKCSLEIQQFMKTYKEERKKNGESYFELRLGIHTGSVVAGVVGLKKFAYDIWGDTVNIASRMESSGEVGKVNISGTTYEHVKEQFVCNYRGKIQAKNKGEIDMYFVESEKGKGCCGEEVYEGVGRFKL